MLNTVFAARRCDENGDFLPEGAPYPPLSVRAPEDFSPFESRTHFEIGDFLFRRAELSGKKIDELMQLWSCTLPEDQDPPFAGHSHLYHTIDSIQFGDVPWQRLFIKYQGPSLHSGYMIPSWMIYEYDIWFRNP